MNCTAVLNKYCVKNGFNLTDSEDKLLMVFLNVVVGHGITFKAAISCSYERSFGS